MLGYDKLGYDEIDGGLLEYMRMGDTQELRNGVLGQGEQHALDQEELRVGEDWVQNEE